MNWAQDNHQRWKDRECLNELLGRSWCMRVRRRQRWAGTYAVARQLRKQGVGLATALLLLTGRVI